MTMRPDTIEAPAPASTCTGNVAIWDQTVGCPECGEELWNYPGIDELGLTIEAYEARFWQRHPFSFRKCHDGGDEDAAAWKEERPIGGWAATFNRGHYGNAIEKHIH
jgi:hypothetical protein